MSSPLSITYNIQHTTEIFCKIKLNAIILRFNSYWIPAPKVVPVYKCVVKHSS